MADGAKDYLYERRIPHLFEGLIAALMVHKPEDHIAFIQACLVKAQMNSELRWDSFINDPELAASVKKRASSRSLFTENKPLPPIQDEEPAGGAELARPASQSNTQVSPKRLPPIGSNTNRVGSDTQLAAKLKDTPLIFVLGGPGSGKGTQCDRIVQDFGFTHLSAGDLLREEVAKGTSQGKQLEEMMKQGKLVPAEVTVGLLKQAILSHPEAVGFLIDGFPRELSQAPLFTQQICECTMVLMFECSEGVMVKRLLERGKTSGRVDDNEETVRKRLQTFQKSTLPVIQHYEAKGKVKKINSDQGVDAVYADVLKALSQFKKVDLKKRLQNTPVVFVLGGPGSGKGTQCDRIVQDFGFTHLSAGDLLREEVAKGTSQGKQLEEMMKQGKLVPAEVTVGLLKQAILSHPEAVGFLIDGFPRELSQAPLFTQQICECTMVLMFECSEGVMVKRLLERGKTSGRVDDNEETIRKRLQTFQKSTLPVIQHYEAKGKVKKINSDQGVDAVYSDVLKAFSQFKKVDLKNRLQNTPVVFVLGGPGSGKGTQCDRIVQDFGFTHLSAGDLLREEVAKGTSQGKQLEEMMKQGKLVPAEVTVGLLKQAILSHPEAVGFLIDGFPRELSQAPLFTQQICECTMVLMFECSEGVMVKRLLERGKTSGRVDDNEETIRKRLQTFQKSTLPVIQHYEAKGKVKKINSDQGVDAVYSDVLKALSQFKKVDLKKRLQNTPVVFVLGGPGSGKGTQCDRIVQDFGFTHLSAGDLLREEVAKGTSQGKQLEDMMKQGKLVPAEVTVGLLKQAILSHPEAVGFLIDGFPRELSQAPLFTQQICECTMVLMFECSEGVMVKRLLERGKTSGRVDDNEETIRKRLQTFQKSTLPVIQHYEAKGKVKKINSDQGVDAVYADVLKALSQFKKVDLKKRLQNTPVVFVLGGPGSGKGTQCDRIVQDFGFTHLSAGDLLREEVAKGTSQGKQLEEMMKQGKLVPAEVTVGLLKQAILSHPEAVGFLIDGFPRELSQAPLFTQQICECTTVLMFECSEGVMVKRLLERGKTSGRVDDNEETIRKRLQTFQKSTLPVIQHYEAKGKVKKINSDQGVDAVYADVLKALSQFKKATPDLNKKLQNTPVVFVLGGPGSGKGTQCDRIVQDFGFTHLSAGDLLREEVAKGTSQGKQLEDMMKQGKLVPAEVTVGLLKQAILSHPEAVGFLIDGFPRELSQAPLFTQQICECTMVLMFECSEGVMVKRLLERGKTSGRVDDNEETIRKRLQTFQKSTLPVIQHYEAKGKVKIINAERDVNEVFSDVQEIFDKLTSN
ncbi:hypothetical protein EMCRGX_G020260 [Ephydatia muelleri]|eukprot:Em0016g194a